MLRTLKITFIISSLLVSGMGYGEGINWSGFMNIGVEFSDSEKGYEGQDFKETDFRENSNVGLNISGAVSDNLFAAAQLVARLEDGDGATAMAADWAFLNYEPVDGFTVRAGRIKLPVFVASEYIDVGYSFLWTSAPLVYENYQLKSLDGISLTYSKGLGAMEFMVELWNGNLSKTFGTSSIDGSPVLLDGRHVYGGRMVLSADNWSARVAYNRAFWDASWGWFDREYASIFASVTADFGPFHFMAESETRKLDNKSDVEAQAAGLLAEAAAANAALEAAQATGNPAAIVPATIASARAGLNAAGANAGLDDTVNSYASVAYDATETITPYLLYETTSGGDNPFFGVDYTANAIGVKVMTGDASVIKFQARQTTIEGDTFGIFPGAFPTASGGQPVKAQIDAGTVEETSMDYQMTWSMIF